MTPALLTALVYGTTLGGAIVPGPTGARADTLEGHVLGRVVSAETGAPLAAATVELRGGGEYRLVVTDEAGRYRIAGVGSGARTLVARALDHAPVAAGVRVPPGGSVSLDLRLDVRPVVLPPLFTRVERRARGLPVPGLARSALRQEGETALRALEAAPGVAELGVGGSDGRPGPGPGDPSSVLYVRGATQDLKLVLLDGAPVYAPFHLGGLIDPFPGGLLERATLYTGGTPARLDGGLSYVLDLELREADRERLRARGMADLLGVGGRAEGPLGPDARLLLAGRAVHGVGYPAVTGGEDLPYGYGDLLGRFDVDAAGGKLSATGFWNRESVELGPAPEGDPAPLGSAFWGNAAGSLRYRAPLAGGTLALTGAHGSFRTRIPVEVDAFRVADGSTDRSRGEALFEIGHGVVRWIGGLALDRYRTALERRSPSGDTTSRISLEGEVAAAHLEAEWWPVRDVEVVTGLRADYFLPDGEPRLAPRVSVAWHVGEAAVLRAAAGRFHQFVRGPETILSSDLTGPTVGSLENAEPADGAAEGGVGSAGHEALFSIAGATHLVVGLSNRLDHDLRLGVEGYFKSFDGLPRARTLRASGADLWVHREEGAVRGWVGYSLAWVWTDDDEGAADTRFVGRHLLTGGIDTDLRGFELGLRVAYGAGLPFTAVPSTDVTSPLSAEGDRGGSLPEEVEPPPPALSGAPDDSYLRLDAEVSRPWQARLGDRTLEIAPYLRVLNALDARNALFYRSQEGGPGEPAPLASVPLLAVLGVSWGF